MFDNRGRRFFDCSSVDQLSSVRERYRVKCALGLSLAGEKQYGEAEPLLVDGYQEMMERRATILADGRAETDKEAR